MAKDKPTPINREKFLNNLHDSYQLPEQSLQPYDNSNPEAKYTKPGQPEHVRANEISMKGDTSPNIRISLEDHDETILYYLKNNIKPTVEINGNKREVPVIYGSPERWKSIQKDGFYRDKNGKIQTPIIILKRENFEKNRSIGNKLDGNKVNNVQYFKKGYSARNSYDNFSVLQNQIPSQEYQVGIIPDYITITYKLTIFTDYVEHMNQLIEAIEFASDSYWGDKERFMFRANITNFPTPIIVESGDDRASRSDLTLTVQGYIIPDTVNVNNAAPSPKSFNVTKILFKEFFDESQSVQRNVPVGSKRINIYNPQAPQNKSIPTIYYGIFSGSFYGNGYGLEINKITSGSVSASISYENGLQINTDVFGNSFQVYDDVTQQWIVFSSFENGFNITYQDGTNLIFAQDGEFSIGDISNNDMATIRNILLTENRVYDYPDKDGVIALLSDILNITGSFVTTSSFNNFVTFYNTGSFTGSFIGDGSQLINLPTSSIDTNLSYTVSGNTLTITSDTGNDVSIPLATASAAGLQSKEDKSKLDGIAAGATANSSDSTLLNRSNHIGTQLASTISDFTAAVNALLGNPIKSIVADYTNSSGVTGTASETLISSYKINANTLSALDFMNMRLRLLKTGVTAGYSITIRIGTTSTFSTSLTQIATYGWTVPGAVDVNFQRYFKIEGGFLKGSNFTIAMLNNQGASVVYYESTVAFNTTVDNWIFISVKPQSNNADVIKQSIFKITN